MSVVNVVGGGAVADAGAPISIFLVIALPLCHKDPDSCGLRHDNPEGNNISFSVRAISAAGVAVGRIMVDGRGQGKDITGPEESRRLLSKEVEKVVGRPGRAGVGCPAEGLEVERCEGLIGQYRGGVREIGPEEEGHWFEDNVHVGDERRGRPDE